jgi:hypothetical protein
MTISPAGWQVQQVEAEYGVGLQKHEERRATKNLETDADAALA